MRLVNIIIRVFTTTLMFSILLFGSVAMAASGTNTFTEDFLSTTYLDTANTTAVWGDGSSLLHPPATGVCAQSGPSVAKDAAGNLVFTWNDFRSGTSAVYISKYSPAGVKLWEDVKVADGAGPKIACDSSSNIYIVFNPNSNSPVYVYKYNSSGAFLSSFRADTDALLGNLGNQEIAIDTSNNVYVVYNDQITKFNSSGTRLWGPVRANAHTNGDTTGLFQPDVAVYGSYLYTSHDDLPGTGPFGMNIMRIDPANGNRLWASEVRVADGSRMRIAVDTAGNLCAVYSDSYSVQYKKYSSAGTVVAGPVMVDDQAYAYKYSPDISIDSSNNKYILYKFNSSYPAAVFTVRTQKLSSTDALVWGTTGKQISFGKIYYTVNGLQLACAPTTSGGAIGVWDENNKTLWSNIVNSAGDRTSASDFCIHNAPEYAASAQGQSLTVDTVTENIPSATLTFDNIDWLLGQTGSFYLSNNGGTNWYQVTPGTKYTFPVNGSNLKFKAVISTTNRSINPAVNAVTIAYDYADLTGDTTPPTGTPSTPTDSGAYTSAMQVTFNWTIGTAADPETGITNYFLQIATDSAFVNTVYSGDVGLVTSYTYNTPIDSMSRTYYARVRAKNGAGLYSSWSGVSDGITTDHSSPIDSTNPPTDQGATTTSTTLTFYWNQSEYSDPESGIASFILWVSTDKTYVNSAATLFKGNVGKVGSYSVSGGVVGSTYYARVTAVNSAGLGDFYGPAPVYASDGITVIAGDTTAPTGTPTVPTDAGVYSTSTTLVFNWTAGTSADPESGIAGYSLQVSTTTAFTTFIFNGDTGNVLTKTITGCTNGQTYYARVRAKNGAGLYGSYTGASNGIKIDTTVPTGLPSVPTDAGTYSGSTSIIFNWTKGTAADTESGIAGYYLQVSTNTAFTVLKYNAYAGNVLTTTITGCVQGQTYYARVRARNGSGVYTGYSGVSNGIKIDTTIPTGTPSIPSDQGVTISTTTIVFSWTKNTAADADSGISGYYLQVSTSTSFTLLKFNNYVGNVLNQTITGCLDGQTYYARVRARNGASLYGSYSGASNGIKIQLSGSKVPYVLYSDTAWTNPLSGFMGSANGISLLVDTANTTSPALGATCTKITYDKTKETWGGIYCLYNGWTGPGLNLTGNIKLTFKARASVAGVKVKFGMGASSSADTTIKDLPGSPVSLSTTWTTYTIALSSSDLTKINGLWYFTIAGSDNTTITSPITFYVDEVYYTNSTTSAIQSMYAPSTDFTEGETYVYPNPAKEGKKPTIHVEVGEADKVAVYIYDVAGELQDSTELTDAPNINPDNGQYAYEYQWNTTDKASGVYIVRILATKGSDKLKITRKFAVLK